MKFCWLAALSGGVTTVPALHYTSSYKLLL